MNMTKRNTNSVPRQINYHMAYIGTHNTVRTLSRNVSERKKQHRNFTYEKNLLLLATTLIFMFIFAWFLSAKTNISQVKASSVNEPYKYYTSVQVKQGDSLWSIASSYLTAECGEVSDYINEIKELNHLSNDAIHAGEYLLIPYYEPFKQSPNSNL